VQPTTRGVIVALIIGVALAVGGWLASAQPAKRTDLLKLDLTKDSEMVFGLEKSPLARRPDGTLI